MLLVNARLFPMSISAPSVIDAGFLRVVEGKIVAIGDMADCITPAPDELVFDAAGQSCFPGFIDAHCHVGMWEDGLAFEGDDGNEDTDPCTPHLRAMDGVNGFDRCFADAAVAGVTTLVISPGSANVIAGQIFAYKSGTVGQVMNDQPLAMKFALGENPKTTYHAKSQAPVTRMGIAALIREQLAKARDYANALAEAESDEDVDKPEYDAKCESLLGVLRGEMTAHFHAHRADDILTALRICEEFSMKPVIVHGTDATLTADLLAKRKVPVLAGPLLCDRAKPELRALSLSTPQALYEAGVPLALVTDHPVTPIEYLPLCAALAVRGGMDRLHALRAMTCDAAAAIGLSGKVGSLDVGCDGDFVLFAGDPLDVQVTPSAVFIEGVQVK